MSFCDPINGQDLKRIRFIIPVKNAVIFCKIDSYFDTTYAYTARINI